jgi:HemY protein
VIGDRMIRRRQKKGLEALSSGMIAIGAGDQALATRYALQARKSLPHEPLTQLLRAQAAQLSGDRTTARRIFESMLSSPDTEQLGLRGLYLEAEREGAGEAARQFANRALSSNPKLGWSADALFTHQCKDRNWTGALETLAVAKRNGHIEKTAADRKRAVLLAAQAQDAEENETDKALALALEAHALAPDLVPAAAVAGRILASKGNIGKAAKVIQKTWTKSPHPELAAAYAYARVGDSTRDRFERIRQLAALNPHSIESPIAVATTAIDARMWTEARQALEPLLANRLTQRVATLMARIEAGETGDKGRVREWLARAATAARDPVWTTEGVVSNRWEAISPVSGSLDAFQWRVPVEVLEKSSTDLVVERLEELLAISAPDKVRREDSRAQSVAGASADAAASKAPSAAAAPDRANAVDAEAVTVRAPAPKAPGNGTHAASVSPGRVRAPDAHVEAPADPRLADVTIVQTAPAAPRGENAAARTSASGNGGAARAEPKIFVAPHAPDDPGPDDAAAPDDDIYPPRAYRTDNR